MHSKSTKHSTNCSNSRSSISMNTRFKTVLRIIDTCPYSTSLLCKPPCSVVALMSVAAAATAASSSTGNIAAAVAVPDSNVNVHTTDLQANLDISKLLGLFFTSSNYPKCKLWFEKAIKKCRFDSDRCFEFRRIRHIRVRDIESRLYLHVSPKTKNKTFEKV